MTRTQLAESYKQDMIDSKIASLAMDISELFEKGTKMMDALHGGRAMMESGYQFPNQATFETAEESFWQTVKETALTVLKKIAEFFRMCYYKIRTLFMDADAKDFNAVKYKLISGMSAGADDTDKIRILKWNNTNTIVEDLLLDIVKAKTTLDVIFATATETCHAVMNHKEEWSGEADDRQKLRLNLDEMVRMFFKDINIEDISKDNDYETYEIREALNKKYFEEGNRVRGNVKLKDFITEYSTFESAYSKDATKGIKDTCELMERNSKDFQAIIDSLNTWSTSGFQKVSQEALNELRNLIVWEIMTVAKVAHTIGQEYWIIYFNLRLDLRTAMRAYVKKVST